MILGFLSETKESSAFYCPSKTKTSWSSLDFAEFWHKKKRVKLVFKTKNFTIEVKFN